MTKFMKWMKQNCSPSSKKDSQKVLRILEKYKQGKHSRFRIAVWKLKIARINYNNASSIPLSKTIGHIYFPHGLAGIFISMGAEIGDNCTVFQNVTIGSTTTVGSKHPGAPIIGHDVLIGVGAVILGGIHIGNHVRIGANTTVYKNVPDNCTVVSDGGLRIIPSELEKDNSFIGYKKWEQQFDRVDH